MFKCVIDSGAEHREFDVAHQSAIRYARLFGLHLPGETVEIRRKRTDELLSKAEWIPGWDDYAQVSVSKKRRHV